MSRLQQRSQDYAASLGLSLAVLAGELPAPATDDTADPWMKVTPRGSVTTRDGRPYTFDHEKLVDRFNQDGVDLPADFDHGIALNAIRGVKTPAIGWASDLQARPDGTYAKMDWLPEGKAAIEARTHRYVSPSFAHDKAGEATFLHSISLTAAPALTMPAVASALLTAVDTGSAMAKLAAIAGSLGVSDAGDQAAMLAAIGELRADAVPAALHRETLAALETVTGQVATLSTAARAKEVDELLEEALKAKKIMPYQRANYLAMCSTDLGLSNVRDLIKGMPAGLAASGLDGQRPPGRDPVLDNPRDLAARATAYREEQRKAGLSISQSEAIQAVVASRS